MFLNIILNFLFFVFCFYFLFFRYPSDTTAIPPAPNVTKNNNTDTTNTTNTTNNEKDDMQEFAKKMIGYQSLAKILLAPPAAQPVAPAPIAPAPTTASTSEILPSIKAAVERVVRAAKAHRDATGDCVGALKKAFGDLKSGNPDSVSRVCNTVVDAVINYFNSSSSSSSSSSSRTSSSGNSILDKLADATEDALCSNAVYGDLDFLY